MNEESLLSSYLQMQEVHAKEKAHIEAAKKTSVYIDPELKEANRKRREKLLEDTEVRQEETKQTRKSSHKHWQRETHIARQIRYRERKNINAFLEKLLSPSFYSNKLLAPAPIPDEFADGVEFAGSWLPLFLEDCRLSLLQQEKLDDVITPMQLTRTASNSPFVVAALQPYDRRFNVLREHDLLVLSPTDGTSRLCDLLATRSGTVQMFENKAQKYVMAYVTKRINENAGQRYEIIIKEGFEWLIWGGKKEARVYVRNMGCVSTQVREYQAILNAEFVKLAEIVMRPKQILEIERRRAKSPPYESKEVLGRLEKHYNESQMRVLELISRMEASDLVLVQGPVLYFITM